MTFISKFIFYKKMHLPLTVLSFIYILFMKHTCVYMTTNQFHKSVHEIRDNFFSRIYESCDEYCYWNDILEIVIYFADAITNRDIFWNDFKNIHCENWAHRPILSHFAPGQFAPGQFAPGQFAPGQFAPKFEEGRMGANWPGANWPGANWPGANWPGANWPGANLPIFHENGGEKGRTDKGRIDQGRTDRGRTDQGRTNRYSIYKYK